MQVRINGDSVAIEGYVNAVERASRPLMSRTGQFVERICKGAFKSAIKRNDDIHILLNHDWSRDLGSTRSGELELEENNIGLYARATIHDPDVIAKARNGELIGWSFGFRDRDVENTVERGMPTRAVKDLDLFEVSILDRSKSPAYEGTLITARSADNEMQFRGEEFIEEVSIVDEQQRFNPNHDGKTGRFTAGSGSGASGGGGANNYLQNLMKSKNLRGPYMQDATPSEIEAHKAKQLDIVQKYNPMHDDEHVGIREIGDIKTAKEAFDPDDDENFAYPDFSYEDAQKALRYNRMMIYSSYPIEQGTFVTPSEMMAKDYAGGQNKSVHMKYVDVDEVAWINSDEGQYANVWDEAKKKRAIDIDYSEAEKIIKEMKEAKKQ